MIFQNIYSFYCIFDQINAALLIVRDIYKKIKNK